MLCLKCKERVVKSGHFCQACKADFKAEADRKRKRIKHAERGAMAAEVRPFLCDHHGEELVHGIRKLRAIRWSYVQGLPDPVTGDPTALEDMHHWDYLRDADTRRGPEEGVSASWQDNQVLLEAHAILAEVDPWWGENEHWNFELHDDIAAREWLELPVCGERKGTYAGYKRHKAAGEMACPECAAANAEYKKQRRDPA